MNESLIIQEAKDKKSSAQKILFEQYFQHVYFICIRYIPNQMDAEEIISDAFYKSFKQIHQFEYRGEGSFQAWLSKIVVNECLAFLRKKKLILFSFEEVDIKDYRENPNAIDAMSAAELLKEISALPPGYRTVFNLFIMEGHTHKEIARQLNISESTSKTQLMKAKLFLQNKINHNEKSF